MRAGSHSLRITGGWGSENRAFRDFPPQDRGRAKLVTAWHPTQNTFTPAARDAVSRVAVSRYNSRTENFVVGHKNCFSAVVDWRKISGVMKRWYSRAGVLLFGILMLAACDDDSSQEGPSREKEQPAQDIPIISPRPAPRPDRGDLSIRADLKSQEAPSSFSMGPRYELFTTYDGADIRQVIGVSGRSLWLCFTAPWCPHSKRMIEELKTVAREEKGCVQVVEVDADAYSALAEEFHITRVPTTILYAEGVKLRVIEGAYNADSLRRYLHSVLSRDEDNTATIDISDDSLPN